MRRMKIRAVPNMKPGGGPRPGPSRTTPSSSQVSAEKITASASVFQVAGGSKENSEACELEPETPKGLLTSDGINSEYLAKPVKVEKTNISETGALDSDSSERVAQFSQEKEDISLLGTEDVLSSGSQESQAISSILPDQNLSAQVKQESKTVASANVRRKRIRVAPMVAASRKGAIPAQITCDFNASEKAVSDEVTSLALKDKEDLCEELKSRNQNTEIISSKDEYGFVKKTDRTENIDGADVSTVDLIQSKASTISEESEITIIESRNDHTLKILAVPSSDTKNRLESIERINECAEQSKTDVDSDDKLDDTKGSGMISNNPIEMSHPESDVEQPKRQVAKLNEESIQIPELGDSSISQTTVMRRSKIKAKPALFVNKRPVKKTHVSVKKEPHKNVDENKDLPTQSYSVFEKSSISPIEIIDRDEVLTGDVNDFSGVGEEEKKIRGETEIVIPESNNEAQTNPPQKKTRNSSEVNKDFILQHCKVLKNNTPEVAQEGKLGEQDAHDSDSSNGDKENSSKGIKNKKDVSAKSKASKQNKGKLTQLSLSSKKMKTDNKMKKSEDDSDDAHEQSKQIFRERKEKYRKKLSTGSLEPKSMTMFDLIFFNPSANPMPGRAETTKKKRRLSSKCETESITSDIVEEQKVDDQGLDVSEPTVQSNPESPDVEVCEGNEGNEEHSKEEDTAEEDEVNTFAPRVKIGANGQIILDEQSLKIRTTAAKNRDEILSKAEVVEESNDTAHYGRWSRKRKRSSLWTMKETARFYKALSTVGTDFSLMETLFAWRSRAELKTKFKKEERSNRALVDKALQDFTQFDFSLFDIESDYDPEEDRKACKEAEREEAKRRRQEIKREEKERRQEEKARLKKEKGRIKIRKSNLRRRQKLLNKNKNIKRDTSDSDDDDNYDEEEEEEEEEDEEEAVADASSNINVADVDDCQDASCRTEVESSQPQKSDMQIRKKFKKRAVSKRKSPEQSPLEISEVTVTMETVKYNQPASSEEHIVEKTIVEDSNEQSPKLTTLQESSASTGTSANADGEQKVWHFSVSEIQTLDDGQQIVQVPTLVGKKNVPVPTLTPGTSNVIVMATDAPDSPGELIYHVYLVSPMEKT